MTSLAVSFSNNTSYKMNSYKVNKQLQKFHQRSYIVNAKFVYIIKQLFFSLSSRIKSHIAFHKYTGLTLLHQDR